MALVFVFQDTDFYSQVNPRLKKIVSVEIQIIE